MLSDLARQRYATFESLVESSDRNGRWLVLTHDNPDPDALASAAILARLLHRRFRRAVTVAYGGLIGRAENQEMVRSLSLRLSRVRHLKWKNYRHFALVDAQPRTGNHQLPEAIDPDLVIDHHPLRKSTQGTTLADIRIDYGATATILAEYYLASGLAPSKRLATAIVYAIRSETLDFSRESPGPDRKLYDHFLPMADKRILGRIQNPRLPRSYYATLHEGLENLFGVGRLIVSHLGPVDQPDIVPEIADLLLRMEGKTWSFCTGRFEDRVYCSIRTSNSRADASGIMRRILGRKGKGGGHGMIAGGWYPIPGAKPEDKNPELFLTHRLAKQLRKNPDRIIPLALNEPKPPPSESTGAKG